jgi:hypothetical protein
MSLFAQGESAAGLQSLRDSGILEKAQSKGIQAVALLDSIFPVDQLAAGFLEKGQSAGIKSNKEFLSANKEAERVSRISNAIFEIDRAIIRLTDENLEQGLVFSQSKNQEITRLELAKLGTELQKFIEIEFSSLVQGLNPMNLPSTLTGISRLVAPATDYGMLGTNLVPGGYGTSAQRTFTIPDEIKKNAQNPIQYIPGMSGISSTQAAISNLTPGSQKYGFETANKLAEVTTKSQEKTHTTLESQYKILESSDTSLKMINTQSTLQTQLLQNIQALTAAASRFNELKFGDMKLMLDGKEVKSRIEKLTTQQKPISR